MGKILGIAIKNYGSLKDIKMGQLYSGQTGVPLGNMVAIIGPSGNGKSTLADAFGFIADALMSMMVARQLPLYRSPARRFYQTGRVLRFVPDF